MFDIFNKKKKKKETAKPAVKPSREDILKQAKENAAKARAEIGQENLERIARALMDENKSAGLKARDQIRTMDKGHIADNLKIILDEDK